MFYQESQLSDYLKCKKCRERLDVPRLLPCSATICANCTSAIKPVKNEFNCPVCSKRHHWTSEGLPVVEALKEILTIQPNEVHRSDNVNILKLSLKEIDKKVQEITQSLKSGEDKIKEHCIDLRADLQLSTELTLQAVNDFNARYLARINSYEKDCIQHFEANKHKREEYEEFLTELKKFYKENLNYLNEFQIEDFFINEANEMAGKLLQSAADIKTKIENFLFNQNMLKFRRNTENLEESILGELSPITVVKLSILTNHQMSELMKLCEFPINQNWRLLYRASKDGFGASDFHSRCDGQENTLTIIKSTNGNVFGGYTEKEWNGNEVDKYDPNAFIFSYINKDYQPIKIPCKSQNYAIYCSSSCGPVFGNGPNGHDIYICDNSNTNTGSYSKPSSYAIKSKAFLAGCGEFLTEDIEVYVKSES